MCSLDWTLPHVSQTPPVLSLRNASPGKTLYLFTCAPVAIKRAPSAALSNSAAENLQKRLGDNALYHHPCFWVWKVRGPDSRDLTYTSGFPSALVFPWTVTCWIQNTKPVLDSERQTVYGIAYVWNLKKKKRIQMNFFAKQKQGAQTWKNLLGKTFLYQRWQAGWGEGWSGGLHPGVHGITGQWGPCCLAQGTLPSILWWSMWEKNLQENRCVYRHHWITLLCSRNITNLWINSTSIGLQNMKEEEKKNLSFLVRANVNLKN